MKVEMLDLSDQYLSLKDDIFNVLDDVMSSSKFILGENVKQLEKDVSSSSNCSYGIGVANGSDAIHIALQASGIQPGDEVITTPFTFFATAGAIVRAGARPVFVDINQDTFNIDINKIENAINERTKAIIPVHLYGQMSEMTSIMEIANKYNLVVIEDAAQAIGASANGVKVGELSNAATLSFFPTKNLGAYGDGGMIITNNHLINEMSRVIRVHGSKPKYYHQILGYNSRLDEIQAAILNVKFPLLNTLSSARQKCAEYYTMSLNNKVSEYVKTPFVKEGYEHVFHQYTLKVENRDGLQKFLADNNISTMIYYPVPLHLQPVFKDLEYKEGDFPITESITKQAISLPMWPEMPQDKQDYVIEKIVEFYHQG